MASRFSAARPKRASEAFARTHHGEGSESNKKVRFDVRNPSALAPTADSDAEDDQEDELLSADVIGASTRATKRGAVNIDGYDSDSENEHFEGRAQARGDNTSKVNLEEALDNYNSKSKPGAKNNDSDEEIDMFGDVASDNESKPSKPSSKKDKTVHFLDDSQIEGQETQSKSGGRVHLDKPSSDSDEEEEETEEQIAAAIAEEGLDEEVGLGGLKKHAPKIDAFNMRAEQEEGAFDEAGNFIRKAADADAVHDRWLEGVSKKEMKAAAAAHEKREEELRQRQKEEDMISTGELMTKLILRLEKGENALDALARLRKGQKKEKKVPKWKLNKKSKKNGGGGGGQQGGDEMEVDNHHTEEKKETDPEQERIREAIGEIADAADKLMGREYPDIYDYERERLVRMYYNETGERWVEPSPPREEQQQDQQQQPEGTRTGKMWEFRWVDGRDGEGNIQGPFDGSTMEAWKGAGYFGEGVEFRVKGESEWTRVADFV
ncbi:hypothetical protein B0T21DRAFT_448516 [Apiosordaria backusii]|uniref:GYF domain-containing protein n=1 Tax=Apiosordaria backusii TaxID=314023 RepID=A0AA40K126_9PEZI|nr:hypothetical protein B0T21DRAFT_448516 [Apiosordaria backusii]